MTYFLTFKTKDGEEQEIDMETSNKEEAIHIANQYVRGGEGIVEYATLSDGDSYLEFSYSTCFYE